MLDNISIGDKLDLIKIETSLNDDNRKSRVYLSKVLDKMTESTMQIAMPIYEGRIVPLSVGDKYEACFYTSKGLMQCNLLIVDRYKDGSLFMLEATPVSSFKKVQRREYYRMECRIPSVYRIVPPEEKKELTYEEEQQLTWINGIIIDLSGGGMRYLVKEKLPKGSIIQVKFDFPQDGGINTFVLYAETVISLTYEKNRDLCDGRMEFVKIGDAEREKLIRCIFEEERKKLSKK